MAEDDLVYLLRRGGEKGKVVSEAADGEARAIQLELANAYEERACGVDGTAAPAASEHLNGQITMIAPARGIRQMRQESPAHG